MWDHDPAIIFFILMLFLFGVSLVGLVPPGGRNGKNGKKGKNGKRGD